MDSVHKSNKVHKFNWNTRDVRNQAPLIEKKKRQKIPNLIDVQVSMLY